MMLKLYLLLINGSTSAMWMRVLLSVVEAVATSSNPAKDGWALIRPWMLLAQTFSSMHECGHAATGIVQSNLATTFLQNYARLVVAWLVIDCDAHERTVAEVVMCAAWATSEVGRYAYLTASTLLPGSTPYILLWLRYSLFLVCYPVGILAEFALYYSVLPTLIAGQGCPAVLKDLDHFGSNCTRTIGPYLGYYISVNVVAYVPGVPMLFGRMMSQRRKKLGSSSGKMSEKNKIK